MDEAAGTVGRLRVTSAPYQSVCPVSRKHGGVEQPGVQLSVAPRIWLEFLYYNSQTVDIFPKILSYQSFYFTEEKTRLIQNKRRPLG